MRMLAGALLLLGCGLLFAAAPQQKEKAANEEPQLIRLAPQSSKPVTRDLEWSLLPDPLDQVSGNAAPMWMRAGTAARAVRHKWTDAEYKWSNRDDTPLKSLPRKEVKAVLDKHAMALRLGEQAALRLRCDWDNPPITVQTLGDLPMDDIQMNREVIHLYNLRMRLGLAEGDFAAVHKDLRTGLTLSRHLGESEFLIQELVAIAIGTIMLSRIEEWIQEPGSPNLYWALTELPRPFVDTRRSMRSEMNTIYRSFPMLRELKARKLTTSEAQALVEKFFTTVARLSGEEGAEWKLKLGTTALALKYYPAAKAALLARGRSEKEVEAIPALQAVALFHLEELDRARDEFIKWLAVPPSQGFEKLQQVEQAERAKAKEIGNVLLGMLMPAMIKTYYAQVRTERLVASLRAAEALRMHVARVGQPPAKWSDITVVPLPIDPFTGKGFDEWYVFKDGKAVLNVPAPPGMTGRLGKRFEFVVKAR